MKVVSLWNHTFDWVSTETSKDGLGYFIKRDSKVISKLKVGAIVESKGLGGRGYEFFINGYYKFRHPFFTKTISTVLEH